MSELNRVHKWNELAGVKQEDNEDLFTLYLDLIHEELNELITANTREDELDAIGDILVVVTGAAHAKGVNAEELLKRINDSNYTKFDTNEDDAKLSVEKYANDSRYENVRYKKVGECYIIFGDKVGGAKNKILKSHKYQEPDLTNL